MISHAIYRSCHPLRGSAPVLIRQSRSTAPLRSGCQGLKWPTQGRRSTTTEAGDDDTGHIRATPNEGILFFDNYFPLNFQWLLRIPFQDEKYIRRLKGPEAAAFDPVKIFHTVFPGSSAPKVTSVLPRLKEGGAFVKFSHDDTVTSDEIETKLREHLKQSGLSPWWNPFSKVRARLVHGRPWVEDLYLSLIHISEPTRPY